VGAVASVRKVNHRRRLVAVVMVAFAVLGGVLGPALTPAAAQTDTDRQVIDEQIRALRAHIGEASAEEAKLLTALDASLAAKAQLDDKVAALDGEIGVVQRNLNAAESKLAAAEAEQRGAENRLAVAQQALADARVKLANYAIAAYTGQSEAVQFLSATLKSHSMDELVAKRNYMKAVGSTQAETIALDERLRNEVKDLAEQLSGVRKEAEAQRDTVATERSKLQESRNTQGLVLTEVATQIAHTDELRAQVVARKEEFQAEEAELLRQSEAITAQLQARAAAQAAATAPAAAPGATPEAAPGAPPSAAGTDAPSTATAGGGGLIPPLDSIRVTSPFGYRIHPIYGTSILHTGVDLAASEGTPIHAAGSGVVVSAGWMSGYGNTAVIDHGGGLATLYAHQSVLIASAGSRVSQGQTIGRVGCTGSCTGPHLHFEVRVNGSPVNPMPYIS
jgi:murein DD-endopeptidase MepM/ murein hydrolase activator NlpD